MAPTLLSAATPVRILNSDVLPTWGKPMIAVFMPVRIPSWHARRERLETVPPFLEMTFTYHQPK